MIMRLLPALLAAVSAAAIPLHAQNPLSDEARQAWNRTRGNLLKAAEKMPEDKFSYKPAPESQSFGDLVAHAANSAMGACSAVGGERKQAGADAAGSKASLVKALEAGLAECDKVYGALTDANAKDMIASRRGERSRLGTLYGNTIHLEHEYAQIAVHMRANGIVPPSSEGR
jgi:hypothetical protein